MGNRVYKSSSVNGNSKYIIDIAGELPTILLELDPNNSNMAIKKTYIYANSEVLAQHDGDSSYPRYFYLHDRLGSVRLVINNQGAAQNSYTYNAFGESFPTECAENISNPFKFTGQFFDDEISQYYLRARMYDPALMRFTGRDPVIGKEQEPLTLHKYLYCNNDPINRIDPTGKFDFSLPDVLITMAEGAAIGFMGGFGGAIAYDMTYAYLTGEEISPEEILKDAFAWGIGGAIYGGLVMTPGGAVLSLQEFEAELSIQFFQGTMIGMGAAQARYSIDRVHGNINAVRGEEYTEQAMLILYADSIE